jgi:hypothetical protein
MRLIFRIYLSAKLFRQFVIKKCERQGDICQMGEGGWPPPPHTLFFKEGITPLPICRCRWGVPSPPSGPDWPPSSKKMVIVPGFPPRRNSTRNTGFGCAKKEPLSGQGGRGGSPYPPTHYFSKRGSPPTPYAGAGGGYPPLRPGPTLLLILVGKTCGTGTGRPGRQKRSGPEGIGK